MSEEIFYRKQSPSYSVTPVSVPLVAFKKTHPRVYVFSNFTMFVKQILKDSHGNFKNWNSSYFLSCSPVPEFIASKVRLSSPFGYSHCSEILKTIADHYVSLGSAIFRYQAKKTTLKLEKLLPVDSFLLELIVVSNVGHVSLTTLAFSSFLLILCLCFNKFLFTIN